MSIRFLVLALVVLLMLPLASCSASSQYRAMNELRKMKATDYFNIPADQQLAEAVASGNLRKAREAISQGAYINAVGNESMMPIIWALLKQNYTGFKFLLEEGADPNVIIDLPNHFQDDKFGLMQFAAGLEDSDYLRALLEHGGDPNTIINRVWNMPVIYSSIMARRTENILLLLEFGADINHRDHSGTTPISKAVNANAFEIAVLLLRKGADPTVEDQWGYDAADTVMQFGIGGIDRRTNDLAAYREFVRELKARELLTENPPGYND